MKYIISDLYGYYDQYQMLLEKIRFAEKDKLYVLGDAIDRGQEFMEMSEWMKLH